MKKFQLFKNIDMIVREIPVSEIMSKNPVTMKQDDTVKKAVSIMAKNNISSILIVDKKGIPIGIISDGDLIRKVYSKDKDPEKVTLSEIMSTDVITISPKTSIRAATALMKKKNVSKFPIVEKGNVVGYVTKSDIIKKLKDIYYQASRLRWLPLIMMLLIIIIGVLIAVYLNK
jgi:CBS domain-containing protein